MSKLTILDKAAVIRNETQPLANTRGRVADVLEDIANTLVDEAALNNEATARAQGDQDNANAIANEATARANGDAMKLDKPNSDGSYYIAKTTVAGIPYYQYRVINLSSGQIPVSMGSYIGASLLYESVSGRIGLDTPNPSEKFEVYNGRVKSDGFILTSSAVSPLPKEIKFKGGNFVGAKDDGIERKFIMEGDVSGVDFEGFTKLLINENFGWQKVNWGSAAYQNFAIPTNITQAGAVNEGGGLGTYKGFGVTYKSATTTIAYMRGASHFFIMNGNSISSRRFSIDTTISTQRIYIGFSDRFRQNNPTNVQLDTLIEFVGICMESGNPNLLLMHNDSSGSATVIDTGFTNATKYMYDLTLISVYGVNAVTVKLKRIDTTDGSISIFNHTINSNIIPNLDAKASFALWCVDALGTSEVKVTDYGGTCTWRYRSIQP